MRRREFIALIGGAPVSWPLAVLAQQQPNDMRRIGVLMNTERYRKYAAELIALTPDIVLATANSIVADFEQASRTVPIVFVTTIDPVGSGLVASLARPGGNATGFIAFEFSLNAKLLGLLKEVAPGSTRVAVVRDPFVPAGSAGFAAIQTAAASLGIELFPIGVRDADEIEHASRNSPAGQTAG